MNSVKRTPENLLKMTKNESSNNSWNKPSKGQVEEKRKVNKVLSFVENLIGNIFTIASVSAETYSCSYRIHDRRIYTLITH